MDFDETIKAVAAFGDAEVEVEFWGLGDSAATVAEMWGFLRPITDDIAWELLPPEHRDAEVSVVFAIGERARLVLWPSRFVDTEPDSDPPRQLAIRTLDGLITVRYRSRVFDP